jgi:D-arabinose 5-phosphate isomerase GutQ
MSNVIFWPAYARFANILPLRSDVFFFVSGFGYRFASDLAQVATRMKEEGVPFALVAFENGDVIGSASAGDVQIPQELMEEFMNIADPPTGTCTRQFKEYVCVSLFSVCFVRLRR